MGDFVVGAVEGVFLAVAVIAFVIISLMVGAYLESRR
jgi:hypothetical protein